MLLNTWSLALNLGALLTLFLLAVACRSAIRVLRHWNPASDEARQIGLESEIWLSSTLVAYALGIQIVSLVLLVLAADDFAVVITGAMCATGTLLANDYGMPALLVKMAGVFFYGFWLVIHRLDTSSQRYPLVRVKCWYLLAILPLLALDITLQFLYLYTIDPDIIVSCCAVVFDDAGGDSQLFVQLADLELLPWFYGTMLVLFLLGVATEWPRRVFGRSAGGWLLTAYGLLWLIFTPLSLLAIITTISSYVYAMPFHNCPFCVLKPEYAHVGFIIYGSLLPAGFFAVSAALVPIFTPQFAAGDRCDQAIIPNYQRLALRLSMVLLILFAGSSSFHLLRYLLLGGEG